MRRLCVTAACAILAGCALPAAVVTRSADVADSLSAAAYLEDFHAAWQFIDERYAYFADKQTDWGRARTLYEPLAAQARSRREFIGVLEHLLEELYDPHAHLAVNTASSPRLVPSGTDVWAEWIGGRALITAVRRGSAGERAGLRPGHEIEAVNGVAIAAAVRQRLPATLVAADPAAADWALGATLAGQHGTPVRLRVVVEHQTLDLEFTPGATDPETSPVSVDTLDGNIGYIRVNNSLGDLRLVTAWDSVLTALRATDGLILDLQQTPAGGNSTVARGILGRLISVDLPYQKHELVAEQREFGIRRSWLEYVSPRGPFTYTRPMVVLVGRWTASMGEGMAIALHGMGRAQVVGTRMAGLRGALGSIVLPNTAFELRVPVERLYTVSGVRREDFLPDMLLDLQGVDSEHGRAIEAALQVLRGSD